MDMIAIGGTIGAGLFLTIGSAISQSGPGGAVLSYLFMGIVVYFMMTSLIEMAAICPVPGAYKEYPRRFVDPALGFANGWNSWFGCAITIAAEIVACVILVKYWFPNTSSIMWAAFFLLVMMLLNLFSIRNFGECEFWLSGIKVVAVIAFIIIGVILILGGFGNSSPGLSNWILDGGSQGHAPFVGGPASVISACLVAGFSFCNVELVGISAAESEDAARDVPRTIRSVFGTIFFFYIVAVIIVATLIPFTDPNLLNADVDNVAASPFVIIFQTAGMKAAADIMNIVIITALLSAGNATMYATVRMLYSMGQTGDAPAYFAKLNRNGIPVRATVGTALVGMLAFLTSVLGEGRVYTACYSLAGISTFFNWLALAWSHYRFRKAYLAQGKRLEDLPYRAKFYPFAPIFTIIMCVTVIFGASTWVFEEFNWFDFVTNYGLIPIYLFIYFGYKKIYHTNFVKFEECDFTVDENLHEL